MPTEEMKEYRDKNWDELSDTEKIERMRGIIKGMKYTIDKVDRRLHRIYNHKHDTEGNPMVSLSASLSLDESCVPTGKSTREFF